MVIYRRNRVPDASYFFTVALQNRNSSFLTSHIDDLRNAFRKTQSKLPFIIDAAVILPEHGHLLMTLPENDANYSARWRSIKSAFTRSLVLSGVNIHKNNRGEYDLWQRRFWEHTIRDDTDWENHVNYIHFNPVKHGLVKQVREWPHSSFHSYVEKGILPINWGGGIEEVLGVFGE